MSSLFESGTIFFDSRAVNYQGSKAKYFLGVNSVDDFEDVIICFVFNTENALNNLKEGCNKDKEKFLFIQKELSFQTDPTSLMLNRAIYYHLKEIFENHIKPLETISDIRLKQIKNCIDKSNIIIKYQSLLR